MKKVLSTERLLIREFNRDDWEDVCAMNTDAEVMQTIGNGKVGTIEEEKSGFENILLSYKTGKGLGVWAVTTLSKTFIGAASMTLLGNTGEVQIGYRFQKEYWGQGYATEVTKALVEYGFNQLKLKRIVATTNLDNEKSKHVLEKSGLRFQKTTTFYGLEMDYFAIELPG